MTRFKERTETISWTACAALAVALALIPHSQAGAFPDCNNNGVDDIVETATTFTEVSIAVEWYPSQLADLDGDDDLDLLGNAPLSWRENLDGAGSFGPPQLIEDIAGAVATGDLDADGDLDVVLRYDPDPHCYSEGARVQVYENLGAGSFGSAQVLTELVLVPFAGENQRHDVVRSTDPSRCCASTMQVRLASPAGTRSPDPMVNTSPNHE